MNYPITLQIVRDYLATLGQDEEAGIAGDAYQCPVARAARSVYGVRFVVTRDEYYLQESGEEVTPTTTEIAELITGIDAAKNQLIQPITRAEVEALLPERGEA